MKKRYSFTRDGAIKTRCGKHMKPHRPADDHSKCCYGKPHRVIVKPHVQLMKSAFFVGGDCPVKVGGSTHQVGVVVELRDGKRIKGATWSAAAKRARDAAPAVKPRRSSNVRYRMVN